MKIDEKWTFSLERVEDLFNFERDQDWLRPVVERIERHARERSVENAPIDKGNFRRSIWVKHEIEKNNIHIYFGSTDPELAMKLHEAEYRLGPTSRAQPSTQEGGVGKKFFSRVIDQWANTWADWIEEALTEKIIGDALK